MITQTLRSGKMKTQQQRDEEAFEDYFKATGFYHGPGFEHEKLTRKFGWLAALEYARRVPDATNERIAQLEAEIKTLREYKFMYEELCK